MPLAKKSIKGVWLDVSGLQEGFGKLGVDLSSLFHRVIGLGDKTYFWKDVWLEDLKLKDRFPNLYAIDDAKNCFIRDRIWVDSNGNLCFNWCWKRHLRRGREETQFLELSEALNQVRLSKDKDTWQWRDGTHDNFSIQDLRKIVTDCSMIRDLSFKWSNWIPIKINCFAWRLFQNRIPLLNNLLERGVNVSSSLCSLLFVLSVGMRVKVWIMFSLSVT